MTGPTGTLAIEATPASTHYAAPGALVDLAVTTAPFGGVPVAFAISDPSVQLSMTSTVTDRNGDAHGLHAYVPFKALPAFVVASGGGGQGEVELFPVTLGAPTADSAHAFTSKIVSNGNELTVTIMPITIEITDKAGRGVPGVPVAVTAVGGSAVIAPAAPITNASGIASVQVQLGAAAQIVASAAGQVTASEVTP